MAEEGQIFIDVVANLQIQFIFSLYFRMSSRQASISKSAIRSQSSNSRKIRKFQFYDLSLSYSVRQRLYELLISFDDNVNYEFEKEEIKKALCQILEESQSEIAYVVNNVFRYDVDNDGAITYEQFANFCLEQHFGEMAIQRLHKTGLYARGRQRVMSKNQFVKTINYCLSFIQVHPNQQLLEGLFQNVDVDKDDYITYSDYFTFLKEYFGSQSQSATTVTVNSVEQNLKKTFGQMDKKALKQQIFKEKIQKHKHMQQQKVNIPKQVPVQPVVVPKIETKKSQHAVDLGNRIARLIYHQLKLTTMDHDRQFLLCTDQSISKQLLTKTIKISEPRARSIISQAFQQNKTISYEKLLKFAIQKYICEDVVQKVSQPITKQRFTTQILNNLYFVRAKPFTYLLEQLFEQFSNSKKQLERNQFKQLVNLIFSSYTWPRKTGEERKKISPYLGIQTNQYLTR